jgi:hypothetical protein
MIVGFLLCAVIFKSFLDLNLKFVLLDMGTDQYRLFSLNI